MARNRTLLVAGGAIGLLVAALLLLPLLLDLNGFKPEIAAQAKRMTGRDLVIEGPIDFTLLPVPAVTLNQVRFANAAGARTPEMVEVARVTVQPSLFALLTGRIEPSKVTLTAPTIALEVGPGGKPNWDFAPEGGMAGGATAGSSASLPRLEIEDGTIVFDDPAAKLALKATNTRLVVTVGALDGPFAVIGRATINGAPMTLDATVGARGADGHAVDLALVAGDGRLTYRGTLSELGPEARLSGKVSASADNLVAFLQALAEVAGRPPPELPPLLAGKFKFDGPVELSRKALVSKGFTLQLGADTVSGSLALDTVPAVAVEVRLEASRIDLDRWLAALPLPDDLKAKAPPPPTPVPLTAAPAPPAATTRPAAPPPPAAPAASWLSSVTAKLALKVGEVIYNRKPVRNLAVEIEARGGAVAVPRLAATLPGDLVIEAASTMSGSPARPTVSGNFSLVGPKLRETLSWLAIDVARVPPAKLQRLAVKGRMSSKDGNVQVEDAAVELDELRGKGGILLAFTVPLTLTADVALDTLDLDSYLPPDGAKSAASASPVGSVVPILALLGPSIGLKLKVAKVIVRNDAIAGAELDVARQAGTLVLNRASVADLAGAKLAVRGTVANYWTAKPLADFAFSADTRDMDRLMRFVGAPPAGLGALSVRGGIAGSTESLTIRDFALATMGWDMQANGALALPGAAEGAIKSVAYKGRLVVNGQTIDGSIEADLTRDKPFLSADLRTGVLDFSKLGGGSAARSAAASPPVSGSQEIGTPLRAIDARVKVVAESLAGGAVDLGNAEIEASLKDGVLTVSRFKGGLYGGSINLSGAIDGRQPALSFDLKGDANGIDLATMLRSRSGSNQIGSLIKIAIDGKLNAQGIELRGAGTTIDQIRNSLAGRAQLSGHVRASADRFLQILGSAVTGAAGGVLDATLSNIVSAFGQKGGVEVANLLNAISLVLNRYVNHDNPLSGQVDIAGGVLTDRDLRLQGNGATARIATRTILANATTDTTINFVLAEDPSAPYLIVTARGPFSSLTYGATRGSAKDPPGMTNVFKNVGDLLPKDVPSLPKVPLPNIDIPTPRIPNIFGR